MGPDRDRGIRNHTLNNYPMLNYFYIVDNPNLSLPRVLYEKWENDSYGSMGRGGIDTTSPESFEWFIEDRAFSSWLGSSILPPFPSSIVSKLSLFLNVPACVAGRAYWQERRGGGGKTVSYYSEKAWPSINHSILSASSSFLHTFSLHFFLLKKGIKARESSITLFWHHQSTSGMGVNEREENNNSIKNLVLICTLRMRICTYEFALFVVIVHKCIFSLRKEKRPLPEVPMSKAKYGVM